MKEEANGGQRPCKFPFIIGGKQYDSCTDYKDPEGKKWCSTKTSNHTRTLHTHVGGQGYWGYCPEDCLPTFAMKSAPFTPMDKDYLMVVDADGDVETVELLDFNGTLPEKLERISKLPLKMYGAVGASIGGIPLVCGGGYKECFSYDGKRDEWKLSGRRKQAWGGNLFAAYHQTLGLLIASKDITGAWRKSAEITQDGKTFQYFNFTDLPLYIDCLVSLDGADNGDFFLAGGTDYSINNNTYIYHNGGWKQKAERPTLRENFICGPVRRSPGGPVEKVIVAGGSRREYSEYSSDEYPFSLEREIEIFMSSTEVYNVAEDTWSKGIDLPVTLRSATVVSYDTSFLVVGGETLFECPLTNAEKVRTVYRYMPTGQWKEMPHLQLGQPKSGVAALIVPSSAFCTEDCQQDFSLELKTDDQSNDPQSGTWKPRGDFRECGVRPITSYDWKQRVKYCPECLPFTSDQDVSKCSKRKRRKSLRIKRQEKSGDVACQVPPEEGGDRGGYNADPREFPFIALLGIEFRHQPGAIKYGCGGSLINRYYVLTAAHCVVGVNLKEVVLGERKISEEPECPNPNCYDYDFLYLHSDSICSDFSSEWPFCSKRQVISPAPGGIHVHPQYKNPYRGFDIALIRLQEPATLVGDETLDFSKSGISDTTGTAAVAVPICLPWKRGDAGRVIWTDQDAKSAGWGITGNNSERFFEEQQEMFSGASVDILQGVDLKLLTAEECEQPANETLFLQKFPQSTFCSSGKDGTSSCRGDSGGPVLTHKTYDEPWYQMGIVSFGSTSCNLDAPAVYTKVSDYLEWIDSVLEK